MAQPEAFLVDVYETILTLDADESRHELAAMAGVPLPDWNAGLVALGPALNTGRLALAEAFEQVIAANGGDPRPELVHGLVRRDRELLLSSARLYDDSLPFLRLLRSRGILVAIVSNCSENTRALLSQRGIAELANAVVLSCEAGYAKPAPQVYRDALDRLGVLARNAVFVDDQPPFCAAAAALGISAVQIVRHAAVSAEPVAGTAVVRSLAELGALL